MPSNAFPLALIGLCLSCVAPLAAQLSAPPEEVPAPKVLMVIQEHVKEGREAAHAKSEEAWPRLFAKGNVTSHYIGMTAESGPSDAWFLEPYSSFAAMQKERAAIQHSALAPDLEVANVQDGDLRTGSRTLLSVFRADLSYHPAEAIASLPKCRFMSVNVLRIKYGHDADLAQAARMLIDGGEKSNSDQPVLAYQVISGAPTGTYLLFSPLDSLARMDTAPARDAAARQAMGDRSQKHFDTLLPEIVQSSESLLFSLSPAMSYVSKEFAAADPAFWLPAPANPNHKRDRSKRDRPEARP